MISLLLLTTATLAPAGTPDGDDARRATAELLRDRLEAASTPDDDARRLQRLLAAGEDAAEALGTSALTDNLRDALYAARWRDRIDPGTAGPRLEDDLRRTLADLEFEPYLEAPLPAGFPGPTPVSEIELKSYPAYRMARADARGGDNGAFWQLFQHIQRHDIPMTAPVQMTYEGGGDALVDLGFMYEHAAQGSTGPDGTVEVMDVAPMLVLSIGCRGWSTSDALARAQQRLNAWISGRDDLEVAGPVRQFGYNGPSVPRGRRYFEVQIPVRLAGENPQGEVVIDFTDPGEARRWSAVDDSVMGGVSASRLIPSSEGSSIFHGELSLENNGGFASVRVSDAQLELSGAQGLALRVRGDGKTYKLRLRMDGRFDGVSYEARFPTTAGRWTETRFDVTEFEPTWRGRDVPGAPELDLARVQGVTVMLSDKQAGAFRLELASLAKL